MSNNLQEKNIIESTTEDFSVVLQAEKRIENNMAKELKTSSIVVVLADDGITPIASISDKNFISYKQIDKNRLEVQVYTKEFPSRDYQKTIIEFDISPHNKHMLNALKNWNK